MDKSKRLGIDAYLKLTTEYKSADVIVGAKLSISLPTARAMYRLTSIERPPSEDATDASYVEWQNTMHRRNDSCRTILRNISKKILMTGGKEIDEDELIDIFKL